MSRAAQIRGELNEGMGHLWQAAGYAAGGMGRTAGPAWLAARRIATRRMGMGGMGMGRMAMGRMAAMRRMGMSRTLGGARRWGTRVAAMTPLAAMAPTGGALRNRRANGAISKVIMKRKSKAGRRRLGILVGLLAAGATAGAAGAMAARRRNRMAWEEYETHGHGYPTDRAAPLAEPAYDPMGTP
jgi:hypothetical protein